MPGKDSLLLPPGTAWQQSRWGHFDRLPGRTRGVCTHHTPSAVGAGGHSDTGLPTKEDPSGALG